MQSRSFACTARALAGAVSLFAGLAPWQGVDAAYKMKILHAFCTSSNCSDGDFSRGNLVMDAAGDLFGTTVRGGTNASGVAFELVANAGRTSWSYKVIHRFCAHAGCTDGKYAWGAPVVDAIGNMYGITYQGAKNNGGAVYMLSPTSSGPWKTHVLYAFCPDRQFCPDGYNPSTGMAYAGMTAGAPYDGHTPLFGTTLGGLWGNAYAVMPGQRKWSEQVISQFCEVGDCGYLPEGGVVADPAGNVFGTTWAGGSFNAGVIFEASKTQNSWSYTVLHDFVVSDGSQPQSAPTLDASGHLFGMTPVGGSAGKGVLYELVPSGANSKETVLYNFCPTFGCPDGSNPASSLAIDGAGNIYGATGTGGANGAGVVFRYAIGAKTYQVLYSFCAQANCTDGAEPNGAIAHASGNLFGTTESDGPHGGGTVFELTP